MVDGFGPCFRAVYPVISVGGLFFDLALSYLALSG
jgi:hypothetical protein